MTSSGDDEESTGDGAMVAERYRLEAELGRGGMGRVWRAYDSRLERVVALKELLPPEGMEAGEHRRLATRMEREARAAAMGTHPSIVAVHDVLQHDGRPWIVMEHLGGRSLQDLIRASGPQLGARVLAWATQLLDALDSAHGRGVVHRDVKPANVMITDEGRAVLTDFGIAQIVGSTELTATVGVIGSPGYLAPERLRHAPATPVGDLFSLGATLHFAAAGAAPFPGDTVEDRVQAVLRAQPEAATTEQPLASLIDGLMRKDPDARLTTEQAKELLGLPAAPAAQEGVSPAATGEAATTPAVAATAAPAPPTAGVTGTAAPPPTPVPSPARTGLSWPMVALILGLAALLVVGAGVVALALRDGEPSPPGAEQAAPSTDEEATPAEQVGDGGDTPSPAQEEAPEDDAEAPEGTRWVSDAEYDFEMLVPEGWNRRVEDPSVYFDAPESGVYLQVDLREHPTDDQLAHVQQSESETISSERLPGYERLRMADVTDTVGGDHRSVADWEFRWRGDDGELRRVLARNYTTAEGRNITVAWAAPDAQWAEYAAHREPCLSSLIG